MTHQLSPSDAARTEMISLPIFTRLINGKPKSFSVQSYKLTSKFTLSDVYERYEGKPIAILAGTKLNDGAILLEDGLTIETARDIIRLAVLA